MRGEHGVEWLGLAWPRSSILEPDQYMRFTKPFRHPLGPLLTHFPAFIATMVRSVSLSSSKYERDTMPKLLSFSHVIHQAVSHISYPLLPTAARVPIAEGVTLPATLQIL